MTTNITESQVTKHSSDDDVVLSVQGVSKKFCRSLKRSLFYGVQDIASELVGVRKDNNKLRKDEFWALQDVSFELKRGESLGLVGANGSGKTTLLRIISGLIKPDTGSVKITGRVAPLIALGAGFNPILTGRENIYVNMSILGLSKEEIDERFDEVVDFAEIGDAIDAPVQTYSSGMAARLGFACAIHTEPDVLLIDEVLAVGDLSFRAKCLNKFAELKTKVVIILVSHSMPRLSRVADCMIVMSRGKICFEGLDIAKGINVYQDTLSEKKNSENIIGGNNKATVNSIKLLSDTNLLDNKINYNQELIIDLNLRIDKSIIYPTIGILIRSRDLHYVVQCHSYYDNFFWKNTGKETNINLNLGKIQLSPGIYKITIVVNDKEGQEILYINWDYLEFKVIGDHFSSCPILIQGLWTVNH